MAWRWRKSQRAGPLRWTFSRGGIGWSFGLPGLRYGRSAAGLAYLSLGIPGTGIYWIKYFSRKQSANSHINKPPKFGSINAGGKITTISKRNGNISPNQKLLFWKNKP